MEVEQMIKDIKLAVAISGTALGLIYGEKQKSLSGNIFDPIMSGLDNTYVTQNTYQINGGN